MSTVPRSALLASFLRSFAIQGSWNYRTLIGCGFAFTLLPVLRTLYATRPEEYQAAVQRHTTLFNSHPYLSPMAVGAVAVLEATEPPAVVEKFKAAIRGSLGSLGDRLVWAGFRPVCMLLTLLAIALGAGWALVIGGFLIFYNLGHIGTRIWALQYGVRHGKRLGEKLRGAPVERLQHLLQTSGVFVIGILIPLTLAGRPLTGEIAPAWFAGGALLCIAAARFGGAARLPAVLALTGVVLTGLILGAL
jgi:mannose/fructose/N-acetylgalactosamine-specific phosphotransferase system component IID